MTASVKNTLTHRVSARCIVSKYRKNDAIVVYMGKTSNMFYKTDNIKTNLKSGQQKFQLRIKMSVSSFNN